MSYPWTPAGAPAHTTRHSADAWHYAETNGSPLLDVPVGRIFGITVSDASSCVARSLAHDEVLEHGNRVYVTRGIPAITAAAKVYALGKVLAATGYEVTVTPAGSAAEDWRDQCLIVYKDHGAPNWAGISSRALPYLDSTFVVADACLTCAFHEASDGDGRYDCPLRDLFCANAIRKGAVGYIGATDTAGYINIPGFLAEVLGRGATFGEAFIAAKNLVSVHDKMVANIDLNPMPHYTLLGDPTLRLPALQSMPRPRLEFTGDIENGKEYEVIVPAMRIAIPEEVKDLCETPQQVKPLYFTTAMNRDLGVSQRFVCGFDLPEGFSPVAAPRGWKLLPARSLNQDLMWMAREHPGQGCLFEGAHESGFTEFEFPLTLYERAPDLRIGGLEIVKQEIRFSLENGGNAGVDVDVGISITMLGYGCPPPACSDADFYVSPHFDPNMEIHTRALLEPSEGQDFRVPIPSEVQTNDGLRRYEDYPCYMVHLITSIPEDLIQQDYGNDRAGEVLERD
jgi:hypothetical protein